MARRLRSADSQYMETVGAPVTAVPITLACGFIANNITASTILLNIGDGNTSRLDLIAGGGVAGDPIVAQTITAAGGASNAASTTGYRAGIWHYGHAVFAAANDRRAFLNGGGKGTQTTSRVLSTPDRVLIGSRYSGGGVLGSFHDGILAEAAIWNVALSDAEVAYSNWLFTQGRSQREVRGDSSLVWYAPLAGRFPIEIDSVSGLNLTINVGTIYADSPLQFERRPRRDWDVPAAAAAGGGGGQWWWTRYGDAVA
jgi:hypothetical protein